MVTLRIVIEPITSVVRRCPRSRGITAVSRLERPAITLGGGCEAWAQDGPTEPFEYYVDATLDAIRPGPDDLAPRDATRSNDPELGAAG